MLRTWISIAATAAVLGIVTPANAVVEFDQNVTNNAIFGGGNTNGSYTTDRQNGIELGIRGKLRFNAANNPENTFNSNGDGTYSFDAGLPPTGFSFAPGSASTGIWNFEWSINSNFDNSSPGRNLDDLTYRMGLDFDPTVGTNFQEFDPINIAAPDFADHSIGDNTTAQGAGAEAASRAAYLALIDANNLAQNSWNMEFFDGTPFFFDGRVDGTYTFFLEAFGSQSTIDPLARVEIQVIVGEGTPVPEPTTLSLFAMGLLGLGFAGYRRRRQAL